MSTHPNAILMGVLVPDDLARKTWRAILEYCGADADDSSVSVSERSYHLTIMEGSYDDDQQIAAPEGSIVAHTYLTYGYGDTVTWAEVEQAKAELESWLAGIADKHKCAHSIQLSANYW